MYLNMHYMYIYVLTQVFFIKYARKYARIYSCYKSLLILPLNSIEC